MRLRSRRAHDVLSAPQAAGTDGHESSDDIRRVPCDLAEVPEAESPDRFRRVHENVALPDPQIFHHVAREAFTFVRTMPVDDVVAMLATYSRVIVASPEDRARRLANARAVLHERFPGTDAIDVPMQSRCWRADRMARSPAQAWGPSDGGQGDPGDASPGLS